MSIGNKELNSNTLWVITSDHGEGLGNHSYKGHGQYIYNEQVRVPLIFYFSNSAYGNIKVGKLARHVDILPTLSDLIRYPLVESKNLIDFPSGVIDRMRKILRLKYDILSHQTIKDSNGKKIDKKLLEELKSLGYIR